MADKNDEGGRPTTSTLKSYLPQSLRNSFSRDSRTPVRNKVLAGVVAAGAFVAVGSPFVAATNGDGSESQNRDVAPVAEQSPLSAAVNGTPEAPGSVQLRGGASQNDGSERQNLNKSEKVQQQREKAEAEKVEAEQRKAAQEQAEKKKEFERKAAEQDKSDNNEKQPKDKAAASEKSAKSAKPEKSAAPQKLVQSGFLTSGYHSRGGSHAGIDIGADTGTPIYAPQAGTVISSGPASGFGLWVRVQHDDGRVTVYGHIHSSQVSVGERVEAGQQIATVGSRGQSTGPHLHFEVRTGPGAQEINPIPWLKQLGYALG
ncbi:Murein DD-endopeptidase MepM and murein hydrolase activator NlpD, contain LysM domain [Actinopolyspora mzabensis]|uniref:Murein DD-endopeptidase MepM and murein hydrolase activator NlpD, contain LysM domain n=1 Tax=Actinopolyspora mzabensis TaxID=995066 RepID=A0A1G8Z2M0_ACTMZ|nr:M23 family metallopeptidase [Actinopolyspora mzabensis]SDK09243.1 Murein DD-endopeptidase MepM and murein hydrolase activator NlpD, contain LysM domain [Actinopolyspora mzabensis]